jgi:hypothetical protein
MCVKLLLLIVGGGDEQIRMNVVTLFLKPLRYARTLVAVFERRRRR